MSFDLRAGEVLGVAALEGQGQDELFDVLAGSRRPDGGELMVDGAPVSFRHPGDAIRAGVVYVPADRAEALLMQRSVRENVALPYIAGVRSWGPIAMAAEGTRVKAAVQRLQIDTRAASEVRQLSGGNQQKVTIARWVAGGVQTMLCFDPTRGIDIGTKQQIYELVRELAAAGAAVLFYTSELKEVQLACDRAIVIFGGRIVAEIPVDEADEPTLLRAAYDLPPDVPMPEEVAAEELAAEGLAPDGLQAPDPGPSARPHRPVRARRCPHERGRGRRHAGTPGADDPGSPLGAAQFMDAGAARAVRGDPADHVPDPAELRRGPAPGPGHRGAAPRDGGGRPGHRRHLRRHRPVGRLDDGAHERDRGRAHEGPARGVRCRRGDRRPASWA